MRVVMHAGYFRDFSGMPTLMGRCGQPLLQVDPHFHNDFSLSVGSMKPHKQFCGRVSSGMGRRWRRGCCGLCMRSLARCWRRCSSIASIRLGERFARKRNAVPERIAVVEFAAAKNLAQADLWTHRLTPLESAGRKNRFFALIAAELRLMLQGHRWWWYAIAGALFVACLASPLSASRGGCDSGGLDLAAADLVADGGREARYATGSLIFSAPHALDRQLPAAGWRVRW